MLTAVYNRMTLVHDIFWKSVGDVNASLGWKAWCAFDYWVTGSTAALPYTGGYNHTTEQHDKNWEAYPIGKALTYFVLGAFVFNNVGTCLEYSVPAVADRFSTRS